MRRVLSADRQNETGTPCTCWAGDGSDMRRHSLAAYDYEPLDSII